MLDRTALPWFCRMYIFWVAIGWWAGVPSRWPCSPGWACNLQFVSKAMAVQSFEVSTAQLGFVVCTPWAVFAHNLRLAIDRLAGWARLHPPVWPVGLHLGPPPPHFSLGTFCLCSRNQYLLENKTANTTYRDCRPNMSIGFAVHNQFAKRRRTIAKMVRRHT